MNQCNYVQGLCNHEACGESGAYDNYLSEIYEQEPTPKDYCAAAGHVFYRYDNELGFCYCGEQEYALCERCDLAYQLNLLWEDGCYCKECYTVMFGLPDCEWCGANHDCPNCDPDFYEGTGPIRG